MGMVLEVKGGNFAGRKTSLPTGQTLLIGRAPDRAQFAVPHDHHMSGLHFAVECGPSGCRVIDKKSTNGTFLNGARIQEATLASGDEIKSGQTIFVVRVVPDEQLSTLAGHREVAAPLRPAPPAPNPVAAPRVPPPVRRDSNRNREAADVSGLPSSTPSPASVRKPAALPSPAASGKLKTPVLLVMGWSFYSTPEQWQVQEGSGLQQIGKDEFPSGLVATQEMLGSMTLQQFVESQISMLRQYLREPKFEPAMPPRLSGADESMALDVCHSMKDGKQVVYRRIYARTGSSVGVLTITALAHDLPRVLKSLQSVLDTAAFRGAPSGCD